MSKTEKKPNPVKEANRLANEERHQNNKSTVSDLNIPVRVEEIVRPIKDQRGNYVYDDKGNVRERTVARKVRPSKLIRSDARKALHAVWVEASNRSGLTPASSYSTAQHLAEIEKKKRNIPTI